MSMQCITTWIFRFEEPLLIARRFADLEGTALLYSGTELDSAKHSFLCLFPEKKIVIHAHPNCWEDLKQEIGIFDLFASPLPRWIGYLGYELGCYADKDQYIPHSQSQIPAGCFYKPCTMIHFDHRLQIATLYSTNRDASLERDPPAVENTTSLKVTYQSDTLESYISKIEQIKEWILEGEVYQVNLSQELHLQGTCAPFPLFESIVHLNPAPFMAYLNCGDFSIVSSSPERFLSKKGDILETRPIKGTAPRGKELHEDIFYKETLLSSEKERAELLMITDLMRNDLGKVSLPGTVCTKKIWQCETYQNVFHLLSIIESRQKEVQMHSVLLLQQLFPGGSITGCPKLRAMEKIYELEKRARGVYTGSIGYFAENGDFDFNIAIRTLVVHPNHIQLQLGGAIVIDSDPLKEFQETLHKGRSLFSILGLKKV